MYLCMILSNGFALLILYSLNVTDRTAVISVTRAFSFNFPTASDTVTGVTVSHVVAQSFCMLDRTWTHREALITRTADCWRLASHTVHTDRLHPAELTVNCLLCSLSCPHLRNEKRLNKSRLQLWYGTKLRMAQWLKSEEYYQSGSSWHNPCTSRQ